MAQKLLDGLPVRDRKRPLLEITLALVSFSSTSLRLLP
jgi:hypothetical protein